MSRYIDTEKIHITAKLMADEMGEIYVSLTDVRKSIDQTPTADVVEVVRCKDCVYYGDGECVYHSELENDTSAYGRWIVKVNEDDYCSYGERSEE